MVQDKICQEQVALVRFDIFSGQRSFWSDDLHTAKEIDMDVLRIVLGGFCGSQKGLLLFDLVELQYYRVGSDEQENRVIRIAGRIVHGNESLIDPLGEWCRQQCSHPILPKEGCLIWIDFL